jgi:hypothetical protein
MKRLFCLAVLLALVVGVAGLSVASAGQGKKVKIGKPETYSQAINPADFQVVINNPWCPLVPGRTFTYEDEDGDELNVVEVTYDTEEILGVTCVVVLDTAWVDGVLEEMTYDWYAQDKSGNVWYFGEDTKVYDENGDVISTEGSWKAGVDGAKPGIVMLADPQPGESYRQEYLEGEAEDMAKVLRLNASASVPYGDFGECLKTKEWTPLDPGAVEHKYYAPGVGLVLVEELKGGMKRVELIDIEIFGP